MHGVTYFAILDPVADRTPGVIAGNGVDAMPDQFLDQQPCPHVGKQGIHALHVARNDQVLCTPGVSRGLQPEPPRRVAAQDVALQYAVRNDVTVVGRYTLAIVGHARHALRNMGPLQDTDEFREDLFADGIEQERGTPVLCAA